MNVLRLEVVDAFTRPPALGVEEASAETVVADPDLEAESADSHWRELLVIIDEVLVFDQWDGMGLDPNDLLNPDLPLIPPVDGVARDVVVQRCGCGEVGCGSLSVTITRHGDHVEWSTAREQTGQPVAIGPFLFDSTQYEREIHRANAERPWESREDRVARLVAEALRGHRGGRPKSFGWAGPGTAGTVVASIGEHHPNPRAGMERGPALELPDGSRMVGVEPKEISTHFLGQFTIPIEMTDAEAAASIAHEVWTSDVKAWVRPARW